MTIHVLIVLASLATAEQPDPALESQAAELREIVSNGRRLPLVASDLPVKPPRAGWEMGMVSWVAVDDDNLRYLLQRGENADPVVVVDRDGNVVRSWGKGLYQTPHSIRVDPEGHIWTTDSGSSNVIKFSATGETLMEISVGGQPEDCQSNFCGTSDVAFGPNGRIFIADGYRNARILEYSADGRKVKEWGAAGDGPGQFRLPHSLVIDDESVIYVADRENGRIQRFDLDGTYLGMWTQYGKTFGLHVEPGVVWLATQHRNEPNLSPGWLIQLNRVTGKLEGYVNVRGVHGMSVSPGGHLMVAPGPDNRPQLFK